MLWKSLLLQQTICCIVGLMAAFEKIDKNEYYFFDRKWI